jgi:hypothetical protein
MSYYVKSKYNFELGGMRMKGLGLFFKLRYSPSNSLEDTREITESVAQNSQESYLQPQKYETIVSSPQLRFPQLVALYLTDR